MKKILFITGIILLLINITGVFRSLRNPELYDEEKTLKNRIGDVTIRYPDIKDSLQRKAGENNRDFAVRVNRVVNNGFAHYWKDEGIEKYHLRVPVWENYLLYAASYLNPGKYKRYEFSNYKKNLERGAGLCSSHSIVVKGVLKEHGIPAELWDIAGHVVVRAQVEDTAACILDPDFGIVVPADTAEIQANPEVVRPYYANLASLYYPEAKEPYTTDHVVEIYGPEGNHIYDVTNWFESFSYVAIWVIPVLLMLPFGIQKTRPSNNANNKKR